MLLNEFFGEKIKISKNEDQHDNLVNDVFWFILEHDRLHKEYGIQLINQLRKEKTIPEDQIFNKFSPMVNKGCKEYYIKNNLTGHLKTHFPKKNRQELCNQLYAHYCDHIKG